jgi:ABC-2 type transport system ATP-binding protein
MITIENLSISYDKSNPVIDHLNLSLEEGQIHGIVGLNGAGKTTLLNAIFGFQKADEGSILWDNQKISKKSVAFLQTQSFFYSNITGREYLSVFQNPDFDIEKWNSLFHLPLDSLVDGYSSGMKKKLALLGILKLDKPIIILDEPFNDLDIESCHIIRLILLRLRDKKKTIILTSHIIETLTNLCDFIHYLEKGTIKFSRDKTGFSEFEREVFENIENTNSSLINELV